jgi:exopolyphosphatase / guanosine-5'-triphosphate,3'-diphosphate pyrophosphatase
MPQTDRATASPLPVRLACIDIGSNTTRLLVADVAGGRRGDGSPQLATVVERRAFTRLGRACRPGASLPPGARTALAAVVAEQAAEARSLGAERLRVVATAALRRAADGVATCHALGGVAQAPVELLSEREEARLAFAGATCGLEDASAPIAVLDVGGGSAQLVAGTCAEGPSWSISLPLGSGDLTAAHLLGDPPAPDELAALRAVVERALERVTPPAVARALAVGGSATSLRRLAGPRLDAEALARALTALVGAPAGAVARQTGLDAERVRLLPAGIAVLAAFARRVGPLEVACGGLREGVLLALAAEA